LTILAIKTPFMQKMLLEELRDPLGWDL